MNICWAHLDQRDWDEIVEDCDCWKCQRAHAKLSRQQPMDEKQLAEIRELGT